MLKMAAIPCVREGEGPITGAGAGVKRPSSAPPSRTEYAASIESGTGKALMRVKTDVRSHIQTYIYF